MMQVDPNDPNSVLWLQQALARAMPGHVLIDPTGELDRATQKVIGLFQVRNGLPMTGEPDADTVARIEQELVVLDAQPFKKKRLPPLPEGKPGDPVREG